MLAEAVPKLGKGLLGRLGALGRVSGRRRLVARRRTGRPVSGRAEAVLKRGNGLLGRQGALCLFPRRTGGWLPGFVRVVEAQPARPRLLLLRRGGDRARGRWASIDLVPGEDEDQVPPLT